jgi:hypothetical protein
MPTMTQKRTAAKIAEDLKVGAENRLLDQMFADMCKDLDKQIDTLREEFMSLRTRMQFGDESKKTFRSMKRLLMRF